MQERAEKSTIDFQMPPELRRATPRAIRRRQGAWAGCAVVFGRLFILPHMCVGVFLMLMVPITIGEMFFGTVQQGRIVGKWTTSTKRTNYHIRYAYDVNGDHRAAERSCSEAEYQVIPDPARAQPPPTIEIRGLSVLGHYFHEAMLPGESRWAEIGALAGAALFWNGILSVFVYLLWILPWREKQLYRWGTPVPGRITGKHTRTGKSVSYYLDYEFISPRWGVLKRQQTIAGQQYYHQTHPGQLVTILCYPQKKRPSVIYEFGSFECV